MQRLLKRLASPRLAAVLIGVLIALTVLNVLLPQRTYFAPSDFARFEADAPAFARTLSLLGLDAVFGGWLLVAMALVLSANVTACTVVRLGERRAQRLRVPARTEKGLLAARWRGREEELIERATAELADAGWELEHVVDGVVATRRGAGFWGSVVLHASILVIVIGGSFVPLTSFTGRMLMTEGQRLIDAPENYISVGRQPRLGDAFTGAQLRFDEMRIEYDRGKVVLAQAQMSTLDTEGRSLERSVRVNHPLEVSGKEYLLQDTGLAVDADITLAGRTQALVLNLAERDERGYVDTIGLTDAEGQPVQIRLRITPVPLEADEQAPAEVLLAADPRLELSVMESERPGPIKALAPGDSTEAAPGLIVTFNGVRYWNTFLVRAEPARVVIYMGFALAVAGSLIRFLTADRRVFVRLVSVGDDRQVVAGYASRPWGVWYARDREVARQLLRVGVEGDIE